MENNTVFLPKEDKNKTAPATEKTQKKVPFAVVEAYKTIRDQWQPAKAAERLMTLCSNLIEGNETTYNEGPCSKAYPVKNKIL